MQRVASGVSHVSLQGLTWHRAAGKDKRNRLQYYAIFFLLAANFSVGFFCFTTAGSSWFPTEVAEKLIKSTASCHLRKGAKTHIMLVGWEGL